MQQQAAASWEVYVKWFPDERIGLYCSCGLALTPPATRSQWTFTPAKLTEMISIHLRAKHGAAASPPPARPR